MNVRLIPTQEPCWRCGALLVQVDPPVDGWHYHCQVCQHLTSPSRVLIHAATKADREGIGFVAAVSRHIEVIPET